MNWKWKCNFCGELLEDANGVKTHVFKEHRDVLLYATPIAVDKWEIKKKSRPKVEKIEKIEKVEKKDTDILEDDDLSID